jgi:HEAT repeat protein
MRLSFRPLVMATTLAAHVAGAQGTLASRIAQAPDGVVHVQFDSRPGVCGDGRDVVGYRESLFARNFQSYGKWSDRRCVAGPLRVSLYKENAQVTRIQTQVDGAWPVASGRVTELGTVDSREASAYFFTLVPRLESESGKDRLLLPAVLAADAPVIAPLLAIARSDARADNTRRSAIHWLGQLGDASVVPTLVSFAKEGSDDDGPKAGKKSLASAALAALSMLEDDAGLPSLIDLAKSGPRTVRKDAVFWLGQNGDPRATRVLHTIIEDSREDTKLRSHAIFSLTNGGDHGDAEFTWLRGAYARFDEDALKESAMQGMTHDETNGSRWLIERARDTNESVKVRRSALFWAGQSENTRTTDLVSVYRTGGETSFREHAIFVLSQRQDDAATDALIRIAREDPDTKMRGKALFWLAQKKDPRVMKLISDLVLK